MPIYNFNISDDRKAVSWNIENAVIKLYFKYGVLDALYSKLINAIIIIRSTREVGINNLFIYKVDGTLKSNPQLPFSSDEVGGVYSIWYKEGALDQTVVLASKNNPHYDYKTTFNLRDEKFSKLSLTK